MKYVSIEKNKKYDGAYIKASLLNCRSRRKLILYNKKKKKYIYIYIYGERIKVS